MAGVNSLLSMARTAMAVSQQVADVAGQNISNVNTEGYTRERVEIVPRTSTYLAPAGWFGNGAEVRDVRRVRDALLDSAWRQSSGDAAASGALRDGRLRIESIFGEPSENGLSSAMDAFWNSWSDLASTPLSPTARTVVQQNGSRVAGLLNQFSSQLRQLSTESFENANVLVSEANGLTASIATLNTRIIAEEASGHSANTSKDERDRLVDRLTTILGATAEGQANGTVTVRLGGVALVDGNAARPLTITGTGSSQTLAFASDPTRTLQPRGSLGAAMQLATREIPAVVAELDSFARGLVQAVNAAHASGVRWTGSPPVATPAPDFFEIDPLAATPEADAFQTAGGIRLSAAIAADADNIAASDAASLGPSDNRVANAIAGLRASAVAFTDATGAPTGTESLAQHFRRLTARVALDVHAASSDAEVHGVLAEQAGARRDSSGGVSTDEELITLMKAQQSYAAAARLMTVADEMAQRLIDLGAR